MVETVLAFQEGRKVIVLSPLVRGRKGQHADAFETMRRAGLIRARVDGEMVEIQEPPKLAKTKTHDIDAVVDRLVVREGIRPRLAESIDRARKLSEGTVTLSVQNDQGGWEDRTLSERFACPECGVGLEEVEPRTFSFNSPHGACRSCDGLGTKRVFDRDLIVPDPSKSLDQGAVVPWSGDGPKTRVAIPPGLEAFLARHKLSKQKPLREWPRAALREFFDGDSKTGFAGVIPTLEAEFASLKNDRRKAALEVYRAEEACPACKGARLRPEALAVTIEGKNIHEVSTLAGREAKGFFETLRFDPPMDLVGVPLVKGIVSRLEFLEQVGLGYLTLARRSDTLSGGELQRVRLTSQIGSGLVGVGYVLDEPTTGLHPRDTDRLLETLRDLRDQGNSVLVVEHDEAVIRAADWVIDLGPGAGPDGGRVVAEGPPDELKGPESETARYLRRAEADTFATSDRLKNAPGWIEIKGASEHNLKSINARFPLAAVSVVTGVSGSGKSTLAQDVLARAAVRKLEQRGERPGEHEAIEGLEAIERVVDVDQTPIGRTPRSTPATYTGVFDEIRRLFARTREAHVRGYKANRFSFNVKGGRCESCQGQGQTRVEMQFLADLYVTCPTCGGRRFNAATLEVRYRGLSIADVLALRVDEAVSVFDPVPKVRKGLEALHEAGLGYITLGQSSTTLSGGEAQRVKLAAELGRPGVGRTLYVLDEPTTGLHFSDVRNLIRVLGKLADLGHAVVVIEHNLDVIRSADWVVDLGPEAGSGGGRVVAMGTPEEITRSPESHTGRYLAQELNGAG